MRFLVACQRAVREGSEQGRFFAGRAGTRLRYKEPLRIEKLLEQEDIGAGLPKLKVLRKLERCGGGGRGGNGRERN